jgi:general secretion pathway protein K
MLTVTLVASLSAAALWSQWRSIEIERSVRLQSASQWVLTGALDWARLILREDARNGGADHLAEPWAVPLQDARLSSFLATDANTTDEDGLQQAFLSGAITDLQGRININNLVMGANSNPPPQGDKPTTGAAGAVAAGARVSEAELKNLARLFELLGLPPTELASLAENLRLAYDASTEPGARLQAPLPPLRLGQLLGLGLSPRSLALLRPHITLLPIVTPVNLNTAGATVLAACIKDLGLARAQQLVKVRQQTHFKTLADVTRHIGDAGPLDDRQHSVSSRHFEVMGQLRLDDTVVQQTSVVQRDGLNVKVLWRDAGPAK